MRVRECECVLMRIFLPLHSSLLATHTGPKLSFLPIALSITYIAVPPPTRVSCSSAFRPTKQLARL